MANLDTTRFDRLPEEEILRRIGALLATAIVRSGRLRSRNAKVRADRGDKPDARIDPLRLIADPLERRIAEYLHFTGAASPVELRQALGLRPRSLTRALARLRRNGLCEVVGQTRAARYQLRSDFAQN
jgi:DNA-binding transcriptional ArsR family regulator